MAVDNTDQLQKLIDTAEGPVTIPAGTWWIDATRGLQLRSGLVLNIVGTLQALPNAENWSWVLRGQGVQGVVIALFSQIVGERASHQGTTGEHGMGISLEDCTDVHLSGYGVVTGCWGDGIYVIGCKNIQILGVRSSGNRRNGMSVIAVDGLSVGNAAFFGNGGTAPQCGIDLEPDTPAEFIKNVDIGHCQFVGNAGASIQLGFGGAPESNFSNVKIHDNTYKNNKPISGVDPWYANLGYATCRWLPFYDWWGYPTTLTI